MVDMYNELEESFDGWSDIFEAMESNGCNKNSTRKKQREQLTLSDWLLRLIFRLDGLGRKVVKLPIDRGLSKGFEVVGDTNKDYYKKFKKKYQKTAKEFYYWNRLFGGAVAFVRAKDGRTLEEPLNIQNIQDIYDIQVYDRTFVQINELDIETDPNEPNYKKPNIYTIQPIGSEKSFKVHYTRCFLGTGETTDMRTRQQLYRNIWGDSTLNSFYDSLLKLNRGYGSLTKILDSYVQIIMEIENLKNIIQTQQGKNVLKNRLDIIKEGLDINNMILMGKGEKFERSSSSVSGIPDSLRELYVFAAACSNMPVTLLMGVSPGGLNATGESDRKNEFIYLQSIRDDELEDFILWILNLEKLNKSSKLPNIEEINITWPSLEILTSKEEAELQKTTSEKDKIHYDINVLSSEEIRQSRYSGGVFSTETIISDDEINNNGDDENGNDEL